MSFLKVEAGNKLSSTDAKIMYFSVHCTAGGDYYLFYYRNNSFSQFFVLPLYSL